MKSFNTCVAIGVVLCLTAGLSSGGTLIGLGEAGGWDDINKGGPVTIVLDTSELSGR